MNVSSKLLTATSILSVACDAQVLMLLQSRKICYLVEPAWQKFLLKNLHRSILQVLPSTCFEHTTSMNNPTSHQDCNKAMIKPYLDVCYSQNNASTMCDIPFNAPSSNIIYHQTDALDAHSIKDNVCTTTKTLGEKCTNDKQRYKTIRKWKQLEKGKPNNNAEDSFILRLLSYNILAQNLLENHSYLYEDLNKAVLNWKFRKTLVQQEIVEAEANVICLQEMQEDHLLEFVTPFKELGYEYLYKKRTNDKTDGLLLMYRSDHLILVDYVKVELYQPDVTVLNRDNVGIIAKFSIKDSPETQVVVATTHLLYNPKRNDVRLAQIQLLLAEIERIAFINNTMSRSKYLPIILAGDFNLKPFTGVYKFLTEGSFQYHDKGRSLEPSKYPLSNFLIPPRLCVTDNCQHFNILANRLRREGTSRVMLENTEMSLQKKDENIPTSCNNILQKSDINIDTGVTQTIEIAQDPSARFSSGTLTHPFEMYSVYSHMNAHGEKEATTHQDEWITVDYIFYSNIQPIEKYTLPTVSQCNTLRSIPNFVVGSDHLSIGATFQLSKKKSPL